MTIKNSLFWIAAFVGLMADQVTKYWVVQGMRLGESIPVWQDVFHLTYTTNDGAAFGMFDGGVWWLRWLSLAVGLGLMALAIFGAPLRRWEQLGWGFVLAGALGNGIDRFAAGEVVDFLDARFIRLPILNQTFPVFNLADVFINIGIICLIVAMFYDSPPTKNGDRHPSSHNS
jgi:signal peptidase II